MKIKKVLSLLLLSACIVGSSNELLSVVANAQTKDNIVTQSITTTDKKVENNVIIQPRLAGIVTVTSTSGANVRSGAGTNYSIVGTASYGEDLYYYGTTKTGTDGVKWYQVEWGSSYAWISSSVSRLS
jgi:uncharacterized protein YgiM (DUF1202 family)